MLKTVSLILMDVTHTFILIVRNTQEFQYKTVPYVSDKFNIIHKLLADSKLWGKSFLVKN
jgi:hypothetical protein